MKMKGDNSKDNGQVFTPQYIVEEMLNYIEYNGPDIIQRHIIDNSCGDGAFLKAIVTRYRTIATALNKPLNEVRTELETYIHGIDTDKAACRQCAKNLTEAASVFGI